MQFVSNFLVLRGIYDNLQSSLDSSRSIKLSILEILLCRAIILFVFCVFSAKSVKFRLLLTVLG
jgi:hypothetical protein